MRRNRTLLFTAMFVVLLFVFSSPAFAGKIVFGNNTEANASASASATAVNDVDINNMDWNINDVDVRSSQGQSQASINHNHNAGNNQSTNLVIEDKQQHVPVVDPAAAPEITSSGKVRDFHNDVWLKDHVGLTSSEAKALSPSEGYLWGTKTTMKVIARHKPTTSLQYHQGYAVIGIITFRGNYGTKGYECQAYVQKLAMSIGGTGFVVLKKGVEIAQKGWSIGLGSSGQAGALSSTGDSHGGGSVGSGTAYSTAKYKVRPFITILVLH